MAATLLISDTHLGSLVGHAVLQRPAELDRLLGVLGEIDHLVILGDLLELNEGRPEAEVLELARPALEGIAGAGLSRISLLPGNHDRKLIRPWITAQGDGLELESRVPADATPLLAQVVGLLAGGGAEVEVVYPGLSLGSPLPGRRVWVTHGHYLDTAVAPQGPYGFIARPAPLTASAHERPRRASRGHRVGGRWIQERILRPELAPFTATGLDWQMRRHSLPALARVLGALGVQADYVVFGHVHRLGPLEGDRAAGWEHPLRPGAAPTRFLNTGAWVQETLLESRRPPSRPYRPGGGVRIGEDGIPRPVELLGRARATFDGRCPSSGSTPRRSSSSSWSPGS